MLRFANSVFLTITVASLAACLAPPDCFAEDVFCAALVTDTPGIEDHGTNADTWAGLEDAKANGLVDRIEYIESVDTRDYEKNIAYFAERGFDVIFTTGPGMDDETLRGADLYPDTVFIGMDQPQGESRPNLISITFPEDQMGFAAGVLAARLTKVQMVGAVCETSGIDSMWRYCEGFRAGVKYADNRVKALVIFREDADRDNLFIDEAWGYETGQSLIQRGVDVIFAAGGLTGEGALRAAVEGRIQAIGAERDQGAVLGGSGSGVVTSFYGNTRFAAEDVIRLLRGGDASGKNPVQVRFVPLDARFPEGLTDELNRLLFELPVGRIETGVPPQKP